LAGAANQQRREAGEEEKEEGRQAGDAARGVTRAADEVQDRLCLLYTSDAADDIL
jgi:hypothetical protein